MKKFLVALLLAGFLVPASHAADKSDCRAAAEDQGRRHGARLHAARSERKQSFAAANFAARRTSRWRSTSSPSPVVEPSRCRLSRQNLSKLEAADTQVLGVSMDSPFSNKAWAQQLGVTFPLLSDWGGDITREYGLYDPGVQSRAAGQLPDRQEWQSDRDAVGR